MVAIDRLSTFLVKRQCAFRLGCLFGLSRNFALPTHIKLHGKQLRTSFPDEQGIKVAFCELLLSDCYGLKSIRSPVKTVLDIGANVGIFCLAARQAFPTALIHAYEPNPNLRDHLNVQAAASDARCFFEAVSRADGKVAMELHPDSVQSRTVADPSGAVPATSFRTAVDRLGGAVDFAKIDCEGAEWELLELTETMKRIRYLAMEYHLVDGRRHSDALEAVRAAGFRITRHDPAAAFGLIHAVNHD